MKCSEATLKQRKPAEESKMPCFLHHRCIQPSSAINVTSRLRLQPQISPDSKFIVLLVTWNTPRTMRLKSPPCNFNRKVVPPYLINPLNPELNPICYLLALLGAHYFLHVSRIRVKLLTFRILMSYIYGAPILDVSRSHTTTQHSR